MEAFNKEKNMVELSELVAYTNQLLDIDAFQDYCPNGLQVQGKSQVRKLVSGVTASQALIDIAVDKDADAILVHHGFFWKGEDPCVVGMKRRRLGMLLNSDVSLLAYHLPLDAHDPYGNNVQLAEVLGFTVKGRFGSGKGPDIGFQGELHTAMSATSLAEHMELCLGREPLHIAGGAGQIQTVAWCTGAAQSYIEAAARVGVDAFISGEVSEQTFHLAKELGIHYFAAGHHVTERYGPKALGAHLAQKFQLEYEFVDIFNPV
jgi:dinuclear metal center YbgI/SA1388 family protein